MNESKRGTLVTGVGLVILGVIFIILNLIPGMTSGKTWPLIFIVLAIGFFLPALIWPSSREGLAGLYIPGCVLFVLGGIFFFNTMSGNWSVWAIAWMLIPAGVGLGLLTSALIGKWERGVRQVGLWMLVISLTIFAFFASLFGTLLVKAIGAGLLVLLGIALLLRALIKKPQEE
jgi:hypothetical protein